MHWAAQYIGKPWRLGATGPAEFDCWGLVRHVQAMHYSRPMPAIDVGHGEDPVRVEKLKALLRHSPWQRVDGPALDGDVIQMRGADGPHVGVALEIGGAVGVLHALGNSSRPLSVVFSQDFDGLGALGFSRPIVWRHTI